MRDSNRGTASKSRKRSPVVIETIRPLYETLAEVGAFDDESLAEWISADGRRRLAMGLKVELADYLVGVPDIRTRTDPLDAAIDIALRSVSGASKPDPYAVQFLVDSFPYLEKEIRDAALLADALIATTELKNESVAHRAIDCPSDFGPKLEDGRARYELKERLGEGTTGAVYLAVDRRLSDDGNDALVAIKVIATPGVEDRLRRHMIEEAAKARRLEHANAVRVLDCAVSPDGDAYIVYEYKCGGDLQSRFAEEAPDLTFKDAARVVIKLARAVQAAHFAGLVHCDLKPGNVLLDQDGEPAVTDFGVAVRRSESEASADDAPLRPVGTLAFMSPEQFQLLPGALSPATDIYALGGILYWLLTGDWPNGKTADEIRRHCTSPSIQGELGRSPALVRPHTPRVLDLICKRALAPSPSDRYPSASDFADDLQSWLEHRPIRWIHKRPTARAKLLARRRPALVAVSMLAVMAALIGAAALYTSNHFAAEAERRAQEAALEKERADLEKERTLRAKLETRLQEEQTANWEKRLHNAARRVKGIIFNHGERVRDGFAAQAMAIYLVFEDAYSEEFLDDEFIRQKFANARYESTREIIAEAEALGGPTAVQALYWEYMLGFWLISDDRPQEGVKLLKANLAKWKVVTTPSDPILTDIEAVLCCGRAAALTQCVRQGQFGKRTLKEAFRLDAELAAFRDRLRPRYHTAQHIYLIDNQRAAMREVRIIPTADIGLSVSEPEATAEDG